VGPVARSSHVVGERGHVAQLSAGTPRFAVQVDMDVVRRAIASDKAIGRITGFGADHIDHHRVRRTQLRRTEGPVEHGPQLILELRGDATLDGVVTAVVHSGRELVHYETSIDDEELDGEKARQIDRLRKLAGEFFGPPTKAEARSARARSPRDTCRHAAPVSTDRIDDDVTARPAR
jgi:hypothetical protein